MCHQSQDLRINQRKAYYMTETVQLITSIMPRKKPLKSEGMKLKNVQPEGTVTHKDQLYIKHLVRMNWKT